MLPTQQQLDQIATVRGGDLRTTPFAVLLTALAVAKRTVLIEMRRGPIEKKIVVDEGLPVDCRSNLATETLGRFMVASGKLSDEDFHSALARSASRGVPLGQILVEQELITSFELFRILQQNLARKLLDAFSWREGEFTVSNDVPQHESTLKVKPAQLLVTGTLKFAQQDQINAAIVPLISKKLGLNPDPPFSPDEIRLGAHQGRLMEALARRARIDELAAATDLSYDEVSRLVYALVTIRVALPEDQIPKGAPLTPVRTQAPKPPAAEVGAGEALSVEDEITRNELMQAYLAFRGRDAFDLLQLDESATDEQIRAAYTSYAKKCAPWRFETPALRSLREKAEELFFAAARAFAELSNAEQRMTLIHRRRTLREEQKRSTYANRFAIKTDLLDPEVQYRKGRALLEQGKHREALQFLEFAADCDSQNATYAAEVAWCRFTLSPASARESLKSLRDAMRIDPENGLAVFYAGEISRQTGDAVEAEALLRKACKMMAPDRRPVEALKALMTGKK